MAATPVFTETTPWASAWSRKHERSAASSCTFGAPTRAVPRGDNLQEKIQADQRHTTHAHTRTMTKIQTQAVGQPIEKTAKPIPDTKPGHPCIILTSLSSSPQQSQRGGRGRGRCQLLVEVSVLCTNFLRILSIRYSATPHAAFHANNTKSTLQSNLSKK